MVNEVSYELHNRESLLHIGIGFMAVVVKGDKVVIIFVNPRRGNHGTPQIAPNVFYGSFRVIFIRFCIDIEIIFVFTVTV